MTLAALLAGLSGCLLVCGIGFSLRCGLVRFRLRRRAGHAISDPVHRAKTLVGRTLQYLEESPSGRSISRSLRQAGLAWSVGLWACLLGTTALVLWVVLHRWLRLGFPLDVAGAVVGTRSASTWLLSARVRRRQEALGRQLPELARLLAGSVRAGQTVPQGLERAARDLAPPLGDLVRRAHGELSLGLPLDEALRRLAERCGNQEAHLLCASIDLQRDVGGDLAKALDGLSHVLTERQAALREVAALSAEARAVAAIVPAMSVGGALLLNLISPGVMDLLRTLPGAVLFLVFGGLEALSWFWIRRLAVVTL